MRGLFAGENVQVADDETLRGRVERLRVGKRASRLILWGVPRGLLLMANLHCRCGERPLIRPFGAPSPRWRGEKGVWRGVCSQSMELSLGSRQ